MFTATSVGKPVRALGDFFLVAFETLLLMIKASLFGFTAGLIARYKGISVGDAELGAVGDRQTRRWGGSD
jgi:ABC-type transporter Mla maintaining outer membrane lipid asymmetry permease subunit MlaE